MPATVCQRGPDLETVESNAAYRLHPQVALLPRAFGALAYCYGNRKPLVEQPKGGLDAPIGLTWE